MTSGFWRYEGAPKAMRNGRSWGDKLPSKTVEYVSGGLKRKKVTSDSWEGPGSFDPDQEHYCPSGQYVRVTHLYTWAVLG